MQNNAFKYTSVLSIVCLQMINQTVSFFMFLMHVKNTLEEGKQEE